MPVIPPALYRTLRPGAIAALSSLFLTPAQAAEPATSPPLLSAPVLGTPAVPPRSEEADAASYEHCMKLAGADPAAARELAQKWQARGGRHPADHCFAVALIGLKQYKQAAGRLEKLAEGMIHAPAALRAEVLDQAAQAWLLAGNAAAAYRAGTAALAVHPGDPDLLVDRAEAAGAAGWFDKAVGDLDQVLKTQPSRVDALIYRASAHRALGQLEPALADIGAALKLAPASVPALLERGNIRRLKGDADGARQDWSRVAALAPGSAAATAAKANIERLALSGAAAAEPTAPPANPAATDRKAP